MLPSRVVGQGLLVLATSWLVGSLVWAEENVKSTDETISFFASGEIPEIKLVIDDQGQQQLREAPRDYVRAALAENGTVVLKSVGVKLKGAAGSYQDFDARPCLTLKIDKYKKKQRFHGMEKLHLNNSVQDESLINEWLGSELFRQAGIPAPRVGHVRLWINDRDLGVYIIREGFDEPFLTRSFGTSEGNLYDGGFLADIDSPLEMDFGDDPDNRADLIGLATACFHPEPAVRRSLIAKQLDMQQFLTFMSVERLCGHWDGYTLNMNNYRIYFPASGKGVFLPHGMDQLFGDPEAGLYDHAPPLISAAVMQDDQWRNLYRQRLTELVSLLRPIDPWIAKIDAQSERLRPVLESIDPNLAGVHTDRVNELKERLTQRADRLVDLIEHGMQAPMQFDSSAVVQLQDWYPSVEAENVQVEEAESDGVASLFIAREPLGDFSSSWRTRVLLPRGKYRFEARVKTKNVIPIPEDQGRGAGIRRLQSGRSNELSGTNDWTMVTYEMRIPEDQRSVELILELRARQGSVWFDRESLKIHRLDD